MPRTATFSTDQKQFGAAMGFDKPFVITGSNARRSRPRYDTRPRFVPRPEVIGAMAISSVKSEH